MNQSADYLNVAGAGGEDQRRHNAHCQGHVVLRNGRCFENGKFCQLSTEI